MKLWIGPDHTARGALHRSAVANHRCVGAHRVIVLVVVDSRAIVAEQRWNWLRAISSVGQKANLLFVRLVGHHVLRSDVAIMAAEAEHDSAHVRTARGQVRRQNFGVFSTVAERDRCTIQGASILSPQSIVTGIGGAGLARSTRSAVRLVTASATAAAIVMRAEDVNCGCRILRHHKGPDRQYEHRH